MKAPVKLEGKQAVNREKKGNTRIRIKLRWDKGSSYRKSCLI